ncbi:hypothetical protein [Flavobacterium sp.]|uniref:hypothetical protein n=1 Tax=Flavobacterium sp. TaxID=239 RepID=UPI00391D7D8F
MNKRYEFVVANVFLAKTTVLGTINLDVPSGKIVAIGNVIAGDPENRIINLSILNNGNEVLKPADYRFTEKTNGGDWLQSLRPVDFDGGRMYETRYTAPAASATEDLNFQVLFVIEKPEY